MKRISLILLVFLLILVNLVYASNPISCSISLNVSTEKQFYSNESIIFRFKLSNKTEQFKIEYWVEDSLGNIVKNKRNTTNTNKKSFNPKSSGINIFTIKARLVEIDCDNSFQNISEKIVFFIGDSEEQEQCCACSMKKGLDYFVIDQINKISSGREFDISVNFTNHDNTIHELSVWSYVYRGSKVYSGSRKENEVNFTIEPATSLIVKLPNKVDAEPGDYKIKVKINKNNQKTDYELKWDINVVEEQDLKSLKQLRIEELYLTIEKPIMLIAIINSTYEQDIQADVELHSSYSFESKNTIIEPGKNNLISFDVDDTLNSDYYVPFFVKLFVNETLLDIEEIILTNNENQYKQDVPFKLITGDLILENSSKVYESSGVKAFRIVIYLLLLLSIVANCWFIYKKKKI